MRETSAQRAPAADRAASRRRVTIEDIAREAKVSIAAVSYALNGRSGVGAETRERIQAIAGRMGWRPNSTARALSASRAHAVGLVLVNVLDAFGFASYFMRLVSGIEQVLSAAGMSLVLHVVADQREEPAIYRRWSSERRVDGVIVGNLEADDPRLPALRELQLPAVLVGPAGQVGFPSVWTDDAEAAETAVRHLAGLGHRRIARIGGPGRFRHTRIRRESFLASARELGLPEPRSSESDYSRAEEATRALLRSAEPPTAIVYEGDLMAVLAVGVAQRLGFSVPGDVSIVAWDDSPLCELVEPSLTALRRDLPDYGMRIASQLLALIAGEEVGDLQGTTTELICRASTAAPR